MNRTLFAAVAMWLLPIASRAQTVQGVVVDVTDHPVAGVVMVLLDSASSVRSRALTNERGEFRLTGSAPGTYRIRTTRIGFRPLLSAPTTLGAGESATVRLALAGIPFLLDTIHAHATSACRMTARDSALATWAVWEQVRNALTAGELTALRGGITATVMTYERTLEPTHGRIVQQTAAVRSDVVKQPWRSISADSVRRAGYVSQTGEWTTYSAPGLDVLLSDNFLEDHCFRLADGDPARLGIAFEPTSERKGVPEIQGTAWLDRKSSELRSLEFRYVNVSRDVDRDAGGDMHFVRMRNGTWAISRWSIRMPVVEQVVRAGGDFDTRVSEVQLIGGELILATSAAGRGRDTLWSQPPLVLAGTVLDSMSGKPVRNARVMLGGTSVESATDAAGRFSIVDVLPGNYVLQVKTLSLDSVNAVKELALVFADSMPALTIRVPTGGQIATRLCGSNRATAPGIVIGTASVRGDSMSDMSNLSRSNIAVVAEWTDVSIHSGVVERVPRVSDTRTDSSGAFTICGVPVNTAVTVRAERGRFSTARTLLRIPAGQRFARADLTLEERPVVAVFSGAVLTDSTHEPIPNAEVSLPGLSRTATTDTAGAFRITGIAPGPQQVRVRRLGFGAVDTIVEFAADETLYRTVYLSRVVALDSVVIQESSTSDFDANRRLGLGHFFTRQDIAKFDLGHVSDVLAQTPGIEIIAGRGSHSWVASSRGIKSMYVKSALDKVDLLNGAKVGPCYAQVYLDNVLVYSGRTGPLFDINSIPPTSIEAIEYYAGPAEIPPKYMVLGTQCGVIVIHTR